MAPPERRFDLWSMLPKHNRREDATGDLARFVGCLQQVTDLVLADIDAFPDLFDLERAPEAWLDQILADLGNPFGLDLDLPAKRRLAALLVDLYRTKGTARGLADAIRLLVGVDAEITTPFTGPTLLLAEDDLGVDWVLGTAGQAPVIDTTLVLGESELGADWILATGDRFYRYAFTIEVGRPLTESEQTRIRALAEFAKPAHTHLLGIRWPGDSLGPDHWEIAQSALGLTTFLHGENHG